VRPDQIHICTPGAPAWRVLGRGPNLPADGYVLFVGTLEPRKNVGALLDAYRIVLERAPAAPTLVLAGRATPDSGGWLEQIAQPPLAGRVEHRGYVSREDREALYRGARLVVMPSLDEGFGLPALEAMSAGVPVVVSDRGALPEVVGEGGTIVDPGDPGMLAAAILRLVTDDAAAAERAQAGLARAAGFVWPAAVQQLRHAYLSALAARDARAAAVRRTG
jgi:alpha-1,3-rhamnosyl/mannosyltransferase